MKRSQYFILTALAALLLVAYLILKPTERKEITYEMPDIQLALDIARIVKIEIERGREFIRLEKVQNRWRITIPVNSIADDESMYRLLEGMARFRLMGLASSKAERYKEFGVGQEGTKVTVTNDTGESLALIVGKEGPTPKQSFVRPANSNNVYLAKGLLPSLVNKSLPEWKQRTIFRTEPDIIRLISIQGTDRVTVRNNGKRWMYNDKVIPEHVITPPLSELSFLRADDVIDTSIVITGSTRLHVEVLARELFKFDIYSQRGNYLLKSSISPTVYVVNKDIVRKLNDFVAALATPSASIATTTPPPQQPPTPIVTQSVPPTPIVTDNTPAASPPHQPIIVKTTTTEKDTELTQQEIEILEALTAQTLTVPKTQEPSIEDEGELIIHTVGKTETLETIARKYKVTVQQIKKWNLLRDSDVVRAGMELYVFVSKK